MTIESALRSALTDALLADTGLCAVLGGARVYDEIAGIPPHVEYPYIRIGDVTSDDDQHWLVLHGFSRDSHRQAHILTGALLQALDDMPLKLDGYQPVKMRFAVADIHRETDGRTYHALVRFVAVTEEVK